MTRDISLRSFCLGGLKVHPLDGRIEGARGESRLEPRVMELLVYLAKFQGEVVNRDAMIKDVWRGTLVTDDVISRSVYRIRKALSDCSAPPPPTFIETIPKRGYRLLAEVATLPCAEGVIAAVGHAADNASDADLAAVPSRRDALPAIETGKPILNRRAADKAAFRAQHAALIVIVVMLTFVVAWAVYWDIRSPRTPTRAGFSGAIPRPDDGPLVLMVLPFASDGAAEEDKYLASGMTDGVANELSAVTQLRIIGRNTAARAAAAHTGYAALGHEFGASAVLEGRLMVGAEDLTLNLRLLDTAGRLLHTADLIAPRTKGGVLPAMAADELLRALGVQTPPPALLRARFEPKGDSYRLFLQGQYYANMNTAGGYQQARDYFVEATQIDAGFALAWAALAMSDILTVDFGNRSVIEASAAAQPSLARAMMLQPTLPEVHAVSGLIALYNHDFERADRELRQATALRPSYVAAHMWLGRSFLAQGDVRRAEAAFQRAYELDPQSPMVGLNLGLALDREGRYTIAAQVLAKEIAIAPAFANLYWAFGHAEAESGELKSALAGYRKAIDLGANYSTLYAQYSMLLQGAGDPEAARAVLTQAETLDAGDPAVWAARVVLATADAQFSEIWARVPRSCSNDEDMWCRLAAAKAHLLSGDAAAAVELYESAHLEDRLSSRDMDAEFEILGGPGAMLDVACAYQLLGSKAHAARLIDRAEAAIASNRDRGINPRAYDYFSAAALAMRGETARASELLRVVHNRGWRSDAYFELDPRFKNLHDRAKLFAELR